jgi:serine/threonine protein kinase
VTAHATASILLLLLLCQMHQLLSAISHLHSRGLFHRDIKPENLLVRPAEREMETETEAEAAVATAGLPVVKLADFGQAKPIRSVPPFTEYVSTRWYRAPELLLRCAAYSSPIDVWAAGCVMAELLTLTPLFPGSAEVDTVRRIAARLGPPSTSCWPDGAALVAASGLTFAAAANTASLSQHLRAQRPAVSGEAVELLSAMLCWDPRSRISARQALQHAYFAAAQPRNEGEDESRTVESAVDDVEAEMRLLRPADEPSMLCTSATSPALLRPLSATAAAEPPSRSQRAQREAEESGTVAAGRAEPERRRQAAPAASATLAAAAGGAVLDLPLAAAPPSRPSSAALRPSSAAPRPSSARPLLFPAAVTAAVKLSTSSLSDSRPSSVQSSRETAEQRRLRFVHAAAAIMR